MGNPGGGGGFFLPVMFGTGGFPATAKNAPKKSAIKTNILFMTTFMLYKINNQLHIYTLKKNSLFPKLINFKSVKKKQISQPNTITKL